MFYFAGQKNVLRFGAQFSSHIFFLPADGFDRVFSRIELALPRGFHSALWQPFITRINY